MSLSTDAATSEPLVRFARKVSHDLNNFSTVVRTYSELLLADLPPESATYADVAEIQRAAENMVQYLQRVTRFSRAGAMKRVPVDVDAVAQEAVAAFAAESPARPVEVRLAAGATIQADALWWRDVLLELLRNAHEAAPAARPIVLVSERIGADVRVSVVDEGPGFSESVASQAAEPLTTGKTGVRGAGMGLAIVAAFAGTLGGSMAYDHANGRTTVSVCLPAS
ncbi:sensor histidine kinase [Gemmatimonas sp.]